MKVESVFLNLALSPGNVKKLQCTDSRGLAAAPRFRFHSGQNINAIGSVEVKTKPRSINGTYVTSH